MKSSNARTYLLCGASASALLLAAGGTAAAQPAGQAPRYAAGDFHNHTTCTDGAVSVATMIRASVEQFGLEWLIDAGHGGTTVRDCSLNDPAVDASVSRSNYLYADRIPASAFKGDRTTATRDGRTVQAMWRWQNLAEFNYPLTIAERQRSAKNVFLGMEPNVPGHEHGVSSIINGQAPRRGPGIGSGTAIAEFEYLFDRADNDMSGGPVNRPGVTKISNSGLVGNAAHAKSVEGIRFLQANYPLTSYELPAHLERAGVFSATGNAGYNIEHLRDWNNAGPTVSFGFESQPGHQAASNRGEYRPATATNGGSAGLGTYGGTGIYTAKIGGVWDALLSEGRNWFFFASSDFHNRGSFSPFVRESDLDFYPGEFQRQYIPAGPARTPQGVIDALRSGDAYSVMGDLIANDMSFQACVAGQCTTGAVGMGRTLVVPPGSNVTVTLAFTQPTAPNFSPYGFNNPVLTQVGINQPLNRPVVDHVDFIRGDVTGVVPPTSPDYAPPVTPASLVTQVFAPTARQIATFNAATWTAAGQRRTITFTVSNVTAPTYIRARGTNIPPGTPNVTDAQGNPLIDFATTAVACTDPACPAHLPVVAGQKRVDLDVRGWATTWFYTNPIFIRPSNAPELLVETNGNRARALAGLPPL